MVAKADNVPFARSTLTTIIFYWYYLTGIIRTYIILRSLLHCQLCRHNTIQEIEKYHYVDIIHEIEKYHYVDIIQHTHTHTQD